MEEILKYENRDRLYGDLLQKLNLVKINEKYDDKSFGNFYVTLSSDLFFIDYVNDRSFLDIHIRSKSDQNHSIALSFVQDLIYDPENMNSPEIVDDNATRIKKLNAFFEKDYDKICSLFKPENYSNTKDNINYYLKKTFQKKHPGWTGHV